MTFDNAAWSINGPLTGAALARRAEYAATSGESGVVRTGDLQVTELDVPGVGVQIASGVGLVRNDYQDSPNEAYVVSNPSIHEFLDMPDANLSDKSYILAIVIGDPDFSQVGHPWMLSTDPPEGEETTFEYVRPTLIEVADSSVTTLDVDYPALVIARIDIPASTTTILDSMITNLTTLANPRQFQDIFVSPDAAWATDSLIPSGASYAEWGQAGFSPSVRVPSWATRGILVANLNGILLTNSGVNIQGAIRVKLGSVVGPATSFNMPERTGALREYLQTGGEFDVSGIAGTTVEIRIEGFESVPASPTTGQRLTLDDWSQVIYDIRFFEE